MKIACILLSTAAFALSSLAQTTETLAYDTRFDDGSLPLSDFACSDGVNGLESKGYATLGALPTFPNIGGVYTVTGWNSAECGSCYEVSYGSTTVAILAVDASKVGFTVSQEAMDKLTGGLAADLGRVDVSATQVNVSVCGL